MNEKDIRNNNIRSLYFKGSYTMKDLGNRFNISKQRIHFIVHPKKVRRQVYSCSEPIFIENSFCIFCLKEKPIHKPPGSQTCCVCENDFIGEKRGRGKYPLCPKHLSDSFYLMEGRDKIRELVRIRDGHTCQECGGKWETGQRKLDVHHLKDEDGSFTRKYDTLASLKDMVTLCHKCHMNLPSEKEKMLRGKGII